MGILRDEALRHLELGYFPLWIAPAGKAPGAAGWQEMRPSRETIDRQFARPSNLGLRTGDVHADGSCLAAIDVDLDDAELIRAVEHAIGERVPTKQGKKGATYIIRLSEQIARRQLHLYRDGSKRQAIDILCRGSQTVVPPSIHPETKLPYRWIAGRSLDETPYDQLPLHSPTVIDEIAGFCKDADDPIFKLNDMEWKGVGGGGDTHEICLAAVASMVTRSWPDEDIHQRIARAKREACEASGEAYDWPQSHRVIQEWIDSARAKFGGQPAKSPKLSHGAIAVAFLKEVRPNIRYDWDKNQWYMFTGLYWEPNQAPSVRHAIEQYLPVQARYRATVDGVERSLRDRPELSAVSTDWDREPHLLNTPAGTIDLRDGTTRPASPADQITKCTTAGPDMDFHGSLWVRKLREWHGDETDELDYHQSLAGYLCTGETREHCLPLWIGPGGDGKSVITGAYANVLGTYAGVATDTAFQDTRHSQHSEELAMLCGYRMVRVAEISGLWKEDRIKQITGGESLTASFKHAHLFTFTPTFKLLVTANDAPRLRSVGKDMARRFHVYKFSKSIVEIDVALPEKLRAEAAKILGWMIEGARMYYAHGLPRSASVETATREYFLDNDTTKQWLEEYAEVGDDWRVSQQMAYESYTLFMEQNGHRHIPTRTAFQNRLIAMGYIKKNAVITKGGAPIPAIIGFRLRIGTKPEY